LIITENITVLEPTENSVDVEVCSGDSYVFEDGTELTDITENETYVSTLAGQADNGCDLIVTENISGDSYTFEDGTELTDITENETYVSTLAGQADNGCDLIITENITVLEPTENTVDVEVCSGDSYVFEDGTELTEITEDETYVSTLAGQADNGCDLIVTENITVLEPTENTVDVEVCSGDSYTFEDGTELTDITENETYVSTLSGQADNGCDLIVTENITVNSVSDTSTSLNEATITANNASATYVWLDCDDNFAVIPGETSQSFTATAIGNYAVELTENGCVEVSECVTITTLSILENSFSKQISVYPNPTSGNLQIDLGETHQNIEIVVRNILGQQVVSTSFV